ncbi:hypothetical protein EUGRSUZ_D02084 [Eucalyptus grandis]|uniref:Uncharacterized protein n=2 Tax=Eucalyptus grandis TaxID=71139 RepID=A0ACC3L7S9_EUCGR|nr:hypothetical protein EUGRSUZ_D02084 [Eucalyptus grandis]
MEWYKRKEAVEALVVIGGLIGIQFLYATTTVMVSYLTSLGLDPLTFVCYSSFATFLVLSPIAFAFERSLWPNKLSLRLMVQLVLISFTGMEKVKLSCLYSKVKILGTVVCVSGAIALSLCSAAKGGPRSSPLSNVIFDQQMIIGCLYLIAAVLGLSINSILQEVALADVPAPISMAAIMSLVGSIMAAAVQLFEDHKLDNGRPFLSFSMLVAFSFLGGGMIGSCLGFTAWAIKKRGAVLQSMFSPIATVCSVVYSAIRLGDTINVPSLASMVLIITGLYIVLWAKRKEGYHPNEGDCLESGLDAEKPLLS